MKTLVDTATVATMGFVEVFGSAGRFLRMYRLLVQCLERNAPALVILIDYPEFNLLIAKRARALGIPVFYYIGPQVWAWRRGRVRKIAERVDRMAVVFPFESELYGDIPASKDGERRPLAEFVGHPLLDLVRATRNRDETRALRHRRATTAAGHFAWKPAQGSAVYARAESRCSAPAAPGWLAGGDCSGQHLDPGGSHGGAERWRPGVSDRRG
jgi:lipid A disaccharide synthetase